MRDGHPHVMPVWFVLDRDVIVFTTPGESVKGRALRRDPRIALVVDEEVPPYAFVHVRGRAEISEDPEQLLRCLAVAAPTPGRLVVRARERGGRSAAPLIERGICGRTGAVRTQRAMSIVRHLPSSARRRKRRPNGQQLEMRASGMDNRHPSDLDIATLALRVTT